MSSTPVPFLPAGYLSERSLLSTSGSVKSSMVAPIAGGAGTSPSARAAAEKTAALMTNREANTTDRYLVFIYKISLINRKVVDFEDYQATRARASEEE